MEKINPHLPVYFKSEKEWHIVSKLTNRKYKGPRTGMIMKWDNPVNKKKKILILSGIRSRGMRASIIAVTKFLSKIIESVEENGNVIKVFEGLDKDGDGVIDSIKILE
jgi:glycine/serine hydroxymethyltransferase